MEKELHGLRMRMYQAEALAARADAALEAARKVVESPADSTALGNLKQALEAFDAAKARLRVT